SLLHPVTRSVYVMVLKKDGASPLAPESDEEKGKEAEKADKDKKADTEKDKDKDKDKSAKEEKPPAVDIDLENISQRILALPVAAKNCYGLFAGAAGVLFLEEGPAVDPIDLEDNSGPPMKIHKFEFKTRKSEQILEDVTAFNLSFNGEKMLY